MQTEKTIFVHENWSDSASRMMGWLRCSFIRGQENFSFEYAPEWLQRNAGTYSIDPDLIFYRGRQYVPLDKQLFGLFSDSCPDRWGRMLLNRKEAADARKENRRPRKLTESDYLLGVYDESRMGALRFSLEEGGPFLSDSPESAIPPWVKLRTLEHASLAFENDRDGSGDRWLRELLIPGSSLGGARPKATVQDTDGTLWIAKFPSKNDEYNTGAWEMVAHDLAALCGIHVPEARLETFSDMGSTFLVKRFDREGRRRIHFASAMTLLGKTDGASAADGTGYLDLVDFIRANGAEPDKDLSEMWNRIVFNMAVSNTDDHLRNHGFLLTDSGWRLSPAYDVNPVPFGDMLSLNVTEYDCHIDFALALEVAGYFGIRAKRAEERVQEISQVISSQWVRLAELYGLSRGAIEYMRPAFTVDTVNRQSPIYTSSDF